MTKNWSFAKITDILLKKIEVSDRIAKSLSQQNLRSQTEALPLTFNKLEFLVA